jgi:hypothetical protein
MLPIAAGTQPTGSRTLWQRFIGQAQNARASIPPPGVVDWNFD